MQFSVCIQRPHLLKGLIVLSKLINLYPLDKCWQNLLSDSVNSDLFNEQCYLPFEQLGLNRWPCFSTRKERFWASGDLFCINPQLVENVVLLLEVLNVWDENEESVEWTEMAQVGMRILLAFISQPETEFCATASSKLSKLLKARQVTSQGELCYILGRLHQAFVASKEKGTKDSGF